MSSVKKIRWQSTWQPPLAVLVLQRCGSRRMETPPGGFLWLGSREMALSHEGLVVPARAPRHSCVPPCSSEQKLLISPHLMEKSQWGALPAITPNPAVRGRAKGSQKHPENWSEGAQIPAWPWLGFGGVLLARRFKWFWRESCCTPLFTAVPPARVLSFSTNLNSR